MAKEYVSVNEKEFGKSKSLELTINGKILDANLQTAVQNKVNALNAKLDTAYNVSGLNLDRGQNKISEQERKALTAQLKTIVRGFNQMISQMESEYIGRTGENIAQIRNNIGNYFSDKNIFVEKSGSLASVLKGYTSMDAEAAHPHREKEVSLK